VTIKLKPHADLVVPESVRRRAGIKAGDRVEFKVSGHVISILPKLPSEDEYTPAQRRMIDRELAKGLEDVKRGRTFGPFSTADEMIACIKAQLKKRAAAKKPKRSR